MKPQTNGKAAVHAHAVSESDSDGSAPSPHSDDKLPPLDSDFEEDDGDHDDTLQQQVCLADNFMTARFTSSFIIV